MNIHGQHTRTLVQQGGTVRLLDQRALPFDVEWFESRSVDATAFAIRDMVVRGAGAIGATGAAGVAQAAALAPDATLFDAVEQAAHTLAATRPTAHNLFWGIAQVRNAVRAHAGDPNAARAAALATAQAVADDDAESCRLLGEHGARLLGHGARVATHCNAGWLAFVDWGSALSPVYAAHRAGRAPHVWVDETRPRGQGARLTAFELAQEGVSHAVLPDGASGLWMRRGLVDLAIVGADRIAANGDVANKVGTMLLALAAKHHGVPFYVAAPTSTIDLDTVDGDAIPIEERSTDEVAWVEGPDEHGVSRRVRFATPDAPIRNPAFDVTPASLITGIITERGIVPATREGLAAVARGR
jgi:methylthioribose-1-phosphate isomerase